MFDWKNLFSGSKQLAGLDIGSSSLKLAEIQGEAGKYVLSRFSQLPLEEGVIAEGVPIEHEKLVASIKALFKESGCSRKNVVTSLSGHSVIIKKVNLPTMEEAEMRDLIRDEAGKYLPFDNMEEVNFDFQIVGPSEFNPNQLDVILVAAKKDIITTYTEIIRDAGLQALVMDVDAFALETLYEENYDPEENEVDVLVNIGASITNINVIKNGASLFTRDFTIAGNAVTESVKDRLGLPSLADAEKVKLEGFGDDPATKASSRESLHLYAEPICMEVERSVEYFRSTSGEMNIKNVILSGGSARIPGLAGDLAQRLSIETQIIDPFKKIDYNKKAFTPETIEQIAPVAAVSIGLALRRLGDK